MKSQGTIVEKVCLAPGETREGIVIPDRYVPVFDLHYVCNECKREFKTSALKVPIHCPFCFGELRRVNNE